MVSPAQHNSYPPLTKPAYKACNSEVLVCSFAATENAFLESSQLRPLTTPAQRPSAMSLSPWLTFPDVNSEDQAENCMSDEDILADMPWGTTR